MTLRTLALSTAGMMLVAWSAIAQTGNLEGNVKGDDGKEHSLKVDSGTKLVGPRGREIKGLSDKALKEGARVAWTLDKEGKVKELHLQSARGGIQRKGIGADEPEKSKSKDKDKEK